jgi:uncharacterized protein YcgL (UPF0745 family)
MLKKSVASCAAALFMLGSASAMAQADVDQVTQDLEAQGYSDVMVMEEGDDTILLQATGPDGAPVMIEVDAETGEWEEAGQ